MSNIQNVSSNRLMVQVDGRIVDQNAAKQQSSARSLETGERISGKIISMSTEGGSKNAQVRLGDDTVISAKLNEGMSLKEGQYVSFEVRGISRNQITLTPLYENTAMEQTALKALTAAGLDASQENLTMVKSMMENGMSIDKDSLNSMQQTISSHPGTDPSSIVQMKALNIPINESNIQQFESYKNFEHQVVETMDSIMDDLPEAYNQMIQSGDGKAANDLYGNILKMISDGYTQIEQASIDQESLAAGTTVTVPMNESGASNPDQAIVQGNSTDEAAIAGEQVKAQGDVSNILTSESIQDSQETSQSDNPRNAEHSANLQDGTQGVVAQDTKQTVLSGALSELDISTNQNVQNQGPKMILIGTDLATLIKDIQQDAGLSGSEISKLISSANTGEPVQIDQAALMKELSESYANNANTSDVAEKAFAKLFGNDEYNKLMKDSLKDQWLLEPKDVSSKENVENLYSRLNAQARQLTETLTNALGGDSRVAQNAASLQNNIDFMNQLNEMFHYIQLPLKMTDQDAHGDLYVYSNGKKKFEPGETVSAILHLDMDNLGPLDVYVKMKDTNVKTNFYVADEDTIDLIAKHIDILNERLNKRGYSMEAKMMLHTDMDDDSEDAAVSEMLSVKKMPVISMQSFDARA